MHLQDGHLRPALEVQQRLALDQVLFVPCYQPVHRASPHSTAEQRCAMIALAIEHQPHFQLETLEIERGGASYTVDTVSTLKQRMPNTALVLMMGSDAFTKFTSWHHWQKILQQANVAVMQRPGEKMPTTGEVGALYNARKVTQLTELSGQIIELAVSQLEISSTKVRQQIQDGQPVDYLLPSRVVEFIQQHGLYQ